MDDYEREYFEKVHDASREGQKIAEARVRILLELKLGAKRVLDIGCGFGDFLRFLEKTGVEVAGVDVSKYALRKTREKVTGELSRVDVEKDKLPFADNLFDAVAISDVVEHLYSVNNILKETKRVLKPDGLLFVTTPNYQGWLRNITERIFPDDPTHVNVQPSEYWVECLKKAGYKRINVKGVILHGFPPLPVVRRIFKRFHLPIYFGPIFFPITAFCEALYIFGWKPKN